MNTIFKMLLYLALMIILVAIAYANADAQVDVTWFFGRTVSDVPVFLVILSSMFLGVLMSGVIAVFEGLKHSRQERELRRRIASLETEVKELRNLPIDGGLGEPDNADGTQPAAADSALDERPIGSGGGAGGEPPVDDGDAGNPPADNAGWSKE